MTTTVALWMNKGNKRAVYICRAAEQGLKRCGYRVSVSDSATYRAPVGEVALFYGLTYPLDKVYKEYQAEGKATVLIDLGYWLRKPADNPMAGHHKIVVNGLQPQHHKAAVHVYPSDRFRRLGIELEDRPKGTGDYFLLAGMSEKAAGVYGLAAEQWEAGVAVKIKEQRTLLTERHKYKVVYRPKPAGSRFLNLAQVKWTRTIGDSFSDEKDNYESLLQNAFATVSHHSNVSLEGLVKGVPCFVETGIVKSLSGSFEDFFTPYYPTMAERLQLCYRAAYTQWTPDEMQAGLPWVYFKTKGELP